MQYEDDHISDRSSKRHLLPALADQDAFEFDLQVPPKGREARAGFVRAVALAVLMMLAFVTYTIVQHWPDYAESAQSKPD